MQQNKADWDALKTILQQSRDLRNLYLNSHGVGGNLLGGDYDNESHTGAVLSPAGASLSTLDVANALATVGPPEGWLSYRYVFLDACDSAAGHFPEVFLGAVPKGTCDDGAFKLPDGSFKQRPCCFMGWKKWILSTSSDRDPNTGIWTPKYVCKGYLDFRTQFFEEVKAGENFKTAIAAAKQYANKPRNIEHLDRIWKKWDKYLVVRGDWFLTAFSYCDKTECQ